MKPLRTIALPAFVFASCLVSPAVAAEPVHEQTPRHPDELTLPPLEFRLPEAEKRSLSNGIPVFLFENHDLPLVSISIRFPMGERYISPGRYAVNSLLDQMWDEGGAGGRTPDEIDSLQAALGMTVAAGSGEEIGHVSVYIVRGDLREGLAVWRDVLLEPAFDADRLDRAKKRMVKELQEINNRPRRLASTWFRRLIYGENSPGGYVPMRADIEGVTAAEMRAIRDEFARPERAVIGVGGDIDPDEVTALLEEALGSWRKDGDAPPLEPWQWTPVARSGVYLLPGDFDQCNVRMGRIVPGLTRLSPDYPVARIFEYAFGFLRVFYRTRGDGLSYGTATRLAVGEDRALFWLFGSTGREKVVDLIEAAREELAELPERPLDESELEAARTFVLGSEIQRREKPRDVVLQCMNDIVLGRPEGYAANQIARLQSATTGDLAGAADKYASLDDRSLLLVVGSPPGGPEELEKLGLGPVTVLEPIDFGAE